MNTKSKLRGGLTLLAALLMIGCQAEEQVEQVALAVSVKADVVELTDLVISSTYTGTLEGEKQAVVYAKLNEAVESIPVKEGQFVKANQVLVSLDKYGPSAQYSAALSQYKNSEKNFEKMAYLYKEGAISETEYDGAKTQYEVNKAAFDAVIRLVDVQSPIAGRVTSIDVAEGEFVSQGQKLATVATTNRLRIRFGVNDNEIATLKTGADVIVSSEATEHTATGTIVSVAGSADPTTRSFEIEALFDNRGGHFSPGIFARVDYVRERLENVLTVPQRSVLELEGVPTLFIVNGGHSHRRPITLGESVDGRVVVTSGLNAGDTVVTLGQDFLEDSMLVKVTALNGTKR